MKGFGLTTTLVALWVVSPALGSTIFLSATGLDPLNNLINVASQTDAHWTAEQSSGGFASAQVLTPAGANWSGAWAPNGPNSAWIGRSANSPNNGPDLYSFQLAFDLSSFVLSTVSLGGLWAIDDTGTLHINGHQISSLGTGNWTAMNPFSLPANSGFLNQGANLLSMKLTSTDNSIEGARFQGFISGTPLDATSAPEPRVSLLIATGLAGLLLARSLRH
jgi:hypothetical protein